MKDRILTAKLYLGILVVILIVIFGGFKFYQYQNCQPVDIAFDFLIPTQQVPITVSSTFTLRQNNPLLPFWYTHDKFLTVDEENISIIIKKTEGFYFEAGVSQAWCNFHDTHAKINFSDIVILINGEKQNFGDKYPRIRYPITYQQKYNTYSIDFSYKNMFKTKKNLYIDWIE